MKIIKGSVTAAKGFYSSGIHCGIKKSKKDLALIYSSKLCNAAAVYTTNQVKGEPLYVTMKHIKDGKAQAIIINSGNANTCTGEDGKKKAFMMTDLTSKALGIDKENVLVASTGVIGVPLPIGTIENGMDRLVGALGKDEEGNASEAIMTTDTINKTIALAFSIGDKTVTIGGMAKGSGMIHPNMATMLSFITTDLNIEQHLLQEALRESVNKSYNRISVDGDTSTNDMAVILANGEAQNTLITEKNDHYSVFLDALNYVNTYLAKLIAKDGEGATKLIECQVIGANSEETAEILSKSVIKSNLVKAACFGADANWGRILCALGYSNIELDIHKIDVGFESPEGSMTVYQCGMPIIFDEVKAKKILKAPEIKILVNLNQGDKSAAAWGCDLTYEYVRINGDYRS
ncbi:bifunctional glutamate N-acetyltransferase/amino-acid acetyltransferase ArgJ [Lutispora saccharofermentans]|uniref:Arginine biosynthesis bifunctional protein ArgJ n=1 Tax=Lutispora saccharofermentans TaxID=3024236 RepID=A0ABT1NC82_9FIRM|nr:bifunctional glutamate N-acetyltransferase/amino-acid acetyltransferase ArgJ [Lutispora saccharofermentans]MCQ1528244.1 bifunctional glutamate N-acetyltransferase/amino-acid acetyltransferase ArgJ [Lutispora saccharofermentans]